MKLADRELEAAILREGWILYAADAGSAFVGFASWKKIVEARDFAIKDLQSASAEGLAASSSRTSAGRHTGAEQPRTITIRRRRISLCGAANLVGIAFLRNLPFAGFQLHALVGVSLV
jgi:hypothetical protein